ncbi:MAG: type 1 glutamine amidotransferase [Thermoplasmata archaeon]|nr:MAG: type 1 glutamine amidotransferase [Thermoplasmata archaeon]
MTILVLDNFLDNKYSGYFSNYFQKDLDVFRASKSEFPENIEDYDHIILSGSEDSILNDRKWIEKEMSLVRQIIDKNIPTLGICLGHQLIAKALLGLEGVKRAHKPEIGWKQVTINKDNPLLNGIQKDFLVFNSHFDEVCNLTFDFEVFAYSGQCDVQIFQIRDAPIWGIQFHPEIEVESGKKFIMDLKKIVPHMEKELDQAILEAKESGISERLFQNFYRL